jgi:hypothetical protein
MRGVAYWVATAALIALMVAGLSRCGGDGNETQAQPTNAEQAQPTTAERTQPAEPVPDDLLSSLEVIDDRLRALIQDERRGDGLEGADLDHRIREIVDATGSNGLYEFFKRPYDKKDYDQSQEAFLGTFNCLDRALGGSLQMAVYEPNSIHISGDLERGKRCAKDLAKVLQYPYRQASDELLNSLEVIDDRLRALIKDEVRASREGGDGLEFDVLVGRVGEIVGLKVDLVKRFFAQPVYGVPFSGILLDLDCLGVNLERARIAGLPYFGHGNTNKRVADLLAAAKECKKRLEDRLRKSAESSTAAPAANPPPKPVTDSKAAPIPVVDGAFKVQGPGLDASVSFFGRFFDTEKSCADYAAHGSGGHYSVPSALYRNGVKSQYTILIDVRIPNYSGPGTYDDGKASGGFTIRDGQGNVLGNVGNVAGTELSVTTQADGAGKLAISGRDLTPLPSGEQRRISGTATWTCKDIRLDTSAYSLNGY